MMGRRPFTRISPCLPSCCSPSVVQRGPCGRSPRADPPAPSGGSVGQFANESESVGQSLPSAMTEKVPPRTDPPNLFGGSVGQFANETGSVGQFANRFSKVVRKCCCPRKRFGVLANLALRLRVPAPRSADGSSGESAHAFQVAAVRALCSAVPAAGHRELTHRPPPEGRWVSLRTKRNRWVSPRPRQ